MKFLADHMLGKLAKYLRFMGYDTYYPTGNMSDNEIIEIAKREKRIILTRDKELARRANGVYVGSDDYEEQLRFVVKKFKLTSENMLSRCSLCNAPLEKVDKEKIKGKVPEYVYENHEDFCICPRCHRVYWYGTHTEKIEKEIKKITRDANED